MAKEEKKVNSISFQRQKGARKSERHFLVQMLVVLLKSLGLRWLWSSLLSVDGELYTPNNIFRDDIWHFIEMSPLQPALIFFYFYRKPPTSATFKCQLQRWICFSRQNAMLGKWCLRKLVRGCSNHCSSWRSCSCCSAYWLCGCSISS